MVGGAARPRAGGGPVLEGGRCNAFPPLEGQAVPCGHLRLSHKRKDGPCSAERGAPWCGGPSCPWSPREKQVEGVEVGLGLGWRAGGNGGVWQGGRWGLQLLGRGDQPSEEMGDPSIPQTLRGSRPPPEEASGGWW